MGLHPDIPFEAADAVDRLRGEGLCKHPAAAANEAQAFGAGAPVWVGEGVGGWVAGGFVTGGLVVGGAAVGAGADVGAGCAGGCAAPDPVTSCRP